MIWPSCLLRTSRLTLSSLDGASYLLCSIRVSASLAGDKNSRSVTPSAYTSWLFVVETLSRSVHDPMLTCGSSVMPGPMLAGSQVAFFPPTALVSYHASNQLSKTNEAVLKPGCRGGRSGRHHRSAAPRLRGREAGRPGQTGLSGCPYSPGHRLGTHCPLENTKKC